MRKSLSTKENSSTSELATRVLELCPGVCEYTVELVAMMARMTSDFIDVETFM
jgi:hypothetical protein